MASFLMRVVTSAIVVMTAVMSMTYGAWQVGTVGQIYAKAWLAQQLLESAWSRTMNGETNVRPWPWADTWPIAELTVPRLGIRQIVLSGDSGRVLAFAPGHSEASAVPGGQGVSVVSGHRDTSFQFLRDIQDGDSLTLKTPNGVFAYTVSERVVVDQRDFYLEAQSEAQINDHLGNRSEIKTMRSILLLVTCYPFDALKPGGHKRYLVMATRGQ